MLNFNKCIKVGIADYKISENQEAIVTLGLGSCVGICIHDASLRIGGLAHILLPYSQDFILTKDVCLKYADVALPMMIEELISLGGNIKNMRAIIVGGGNMFKTDNKDITESIGFKNQKSVKEVLHSYRIPIVCEDVGGEVGKTVFFDTATGDVFVKMGVDVKKIYKGYIKSNKVVQTKESISYDRIY